MLYKFIFVHESVTAADELIEECHGLARGTSICFSTYPRSIHPQNRSALSLLHNNITIVPNLVSDLDLGVNHGLLKLSLRTFGLIYAIALKETLNQYRPFGIGISMARRKLTCYLDDCYFSNTVSIVTII